MNEANLETCSIGINDDEHHPKTQDAGLLLPRLRPLAAASLGCAAIRAPLTCVEKGGPAWTGSPDPRISFVLRTDLSPEMASARLTEFETLQAALATHLRRGSAEPASKVEVILFARREDFDEATGRDRTRVAYFADSLPSDIEPQPVMVMFNDFTEETRETFLHELAHRLLRLRFANLPWLNEGLAQYYSTLRIEADTVHLGGRLVSLDFSERPYFWSSWYDGSYQYQVPAFKAPTIHALLDSDASTFYAVSSAEPSQESLERQTVLYKQ